MLKTLLNDENISFFHRQQLSAFTEFAKTSRYNYLPYRYQEMRLINTKPIYSLKDIKTRGFLYPLQRKRLSTTYKDSSTNSGDVELCSAV